MKPFFRKHRLGIAGILTGAVLGFAYYYFIGCTTGTCPITSRPLNAVLYGMILGYLVFSSAGKTEKPKP